MFVQANFGSRAELRIAGVPLGLRSAADCPIETTAWFERELAGARSTPVEEAVVNALVAAGDMRGRAGHVSYALPHEEVRAAFGR